MLKTLTLLTALTALLGGLPRAALAIEEPGFKVVRQLADAVEIREYAPYVVAEVRVEVKPDDTDDAGNKAFPILAGYIFGKNKGERKMAMTAPVTQTAEPMKMAMTAPVTQTAADGGGYLVQFVLPSEISLDTAPEPLDPRVMLREVPAHRLAAIRYSGIWSDANYQEHLALLKDTLTAAGITWQGEPVLSRYDPPIMPWFLRRNEIWLSVP
jgi:hypothetical protein